MSSQASQKPAKTPNVQAFFTFKDSKGAPVSLWVTHKTKDNSPDLDGSIGDTRVAGYIHQGATGGFVSFIDSKAGKGADGKYKQVGTGNVVAVEGGRAKLVITMADGTKVWAEVSKKSDPQMLVAMGLSLELQATKKAEAAAKRASKETAEA